MKRFFGSLTVLVLICTAAFAAGGDKTGMVVETGWLAGHLNDPNVVIVHVGRDRTLYDSGHIPNARFLPLSAIAVTRNGIPNEMPPTEDLKKALEALGIDNRKRLVLYGDHANLYATRAYFTLDYLGVAKHAALLNGGLEKWKSESRATTKDAPMVVAAKLNISPRPELIVDKAAVQKAIASKSATLIDARASDEFSGAKAGDGVNRPGHIPGATNAHWMQNLVSEQDPTLKPGAEIRSNYEKAGLKKGAQPIVYCRTGVQAAHDYFTLKMLGYKPLLYDGSFIEWSNAEGTQVEK